MKRVGIAALGVLLMLSAVSVAADQGIEPGFAKGMVTDSAGHPLGGAVVVINGALDQNLQVTTKVDGAYRMRLPPGAFQVTATISREFDGQAFRLDLNPDTRDTMNDVDGAVRNFTWLLSGPRGGDQSGVYGAFIDYHLAIDGDYYVADPENITFTLTPTGPLIDGSQSQVLTRKGGAPRTKDYGEIRDVPLGHYVMTGVYEPPGKKPQTLRFKNAWESRSNDFADHLDFGFMAQGLSHCFNCASLDIEAVKQPEEK